MRRRLMGLAAAVAVIAGLWLVHQRLATQAIEQAVNSARVAWNERVVQDQAAEARRALAVGTLAATNLLEIQHESAKLRSNLDVARADLRSERQRLQHELARFRARAVSEAGAAGPGPLPAGAGAVADALEQCSVEYEEVAGVADDLAVKVTGLQRYITDVVGPVCLKEPDHDG